MSIGKYTIPQSEYPLGIGLTLAGTFQIAMLGLLFVGRQLCNDIHNSFSESAQCRNKAPRVISKHRLEGFELADSFIPLIMAGDRLAHARVKYSLVG